MTVWIAQCLCPDRHCIVATAGEAETEELACIVILRVVRRAVERAVREKIINPWCSLCGADHRSWHYEVGRTAFRTMEEAVPQLREIERQQAVTNALWGDLHQTKPQ